MKNNISLIGMAGVGKSYMGKALAEKLNYELIEVDALIDYKIKDIEANKNVAFDDLFIRIEEESVLSLEGKSKCIFDTGGSVVYSELAMDFLKQNSIILYLKDSLENIEKRFNLRDGGSYLVGLGDKSFKSLFDERKILYEKYADEIIDVSENKSAKDILNLLNL